MLRFGLIACSSIARRRFLPALKNSGVAQLQHIGSRDKAKAAKFAADFGSIRSGDYEAVLKDPDVDAVYISTPIPQHADWIRHAAEHGKHVICEKPLAGNLKDTTLSIHFCQQKGLRLLEAYSFAFHPQHAMARQWITTGKIGEPVYFTGEFTFPRPQSGDIRLDSALNGGVFHDAAGYPVAAAMMMFAARPESISCRIVPDIVAGVDASASIRLDFSAGRTAHCFAGFGLQYRSRYAVTGTAGRLECERAYSVLPDKSASLILETGNDSERFSVEPVDQFVLMIREFVGQVSGQRTRTDWEGKALQQAVVMECARRSAEERRLVTVPAA